MIDENVDEMLYKALIKDEDITKKDVLDCCGWKHEQAFDQFMSKFDPIIKNGKIYYQEEVVVMFIENLSKKEQEAYSNNIMDW